VASNAGRPLIAPSELFRRPPPDVAARYTFLAGNSQSPRLLASALKVVQLRPAGAAPRGDLSLRLPLTGSGLFTSRRSGRTDNRRKSMSIVDWALLMNAIAQLFSAIAKLIISVRRR
jgi:hypothetical protein